MSDADQLAALLRECPWIVFINQFGEETDDTYRATVWLRERGVTTGNPTRKPVQTECPSCGKVVDLMAAVTNSLADRTARLRFIDGLTDEAIREVAGRTLNVELWVGSVDPAAGRAALRKLAEERALGGEE